MDVLSAVRLLAVRGGSSVTAVCLFLVGTTKKRKRNSSHPGGFRAGKALLAPKEKRQAKEETPESLNEHKH